MAIRKYPVGIQNFENLRKDGYVYVDKTALVYKMITEGIPYFLSRPRRFGKSLLISTLQAVFEGKRELFEAFTTDDGIQQPQLYIATTNWKWEPHPVLLFDFSRGKENTIEALDEQIDASLRHYEQHYGIAASSEGANLRFIKIVEKAHRQTGMRVVVLVDEYDTFMLHSIGDKKLEDAVRQRFSNLFSPLKSLDEHLRFVFITGISKFSQMGIFSSLNQLNNISMSDAYATICGITEEELISYMHEDIECMADYMGQGFDEMLGDLKRKYDGYHFSGRMTDVYNPFSLMNAFAQNRLSDFWFASATSSAVIEMLGKMPKLEISGVDGVPCESTAFDAAFSGYNAPLPVLYQSGYLTIKDYNRRRDLYTLGLPNDEVRHGFANCLYQYITGTQPDDRNRSAFLNAYYDFEDTADLPTFIEALKTFFAGVPYQLVNANERHYHALLYTLLVAFGADVVPEEMSAKGRADIVLKMPTAIYILEIKYDHTAAEALRQIDEKGYAAKYALDGRPIVKVGLSFSSDERNITEWKSTAAKE